MHIVGKASTSKHFLKVFPLNRLFPDVDTLSSAFMYEALLYFLWVTTG